jgi:hypothetical protein
MSDTNNETGDEASNPTQDARDIEIEKLRAKNKELIAEKQKEKAKAQALADEKDDAETRAAATSGDIEALKTAHQRELLKLQSKLEATDGELRTIRVDNAIQQAITQGNVKPEYARAVTAMMKADVQYVDGVATISDLPITDYMTGYLASKEGAHFVRAADNSGGSATGSQGTQAHTFTKKPQTSAEWDAFDRLPETERNATADRLGAPELKV